jgi:uncharacterized surface protein with fasciclin (FAS1) repeats
VNALPIQKNESNHSSHLIALILSSYTVDIICSFKGGFDIACQLFSELEWNPFINYTAFVPTDSAFEELQEQQPGVWNLTATTLTNTTLQLLNFHIVDNNQTLLIDELQCQELTTMANGQDTRTVCISRDDIDESTDKYQKGGDNTDPIPIIISDLSACNGLIHVLDGVLLPEGINSVSQQAYGGTINYDDDNNNNIINNNNNQDTDRPVILPTILPTHAPSPQQQQQQQPPSSSSCIPVMDFVCGSRVLANFCDLIRQYELQDDLQDTNSITLFAPYNMAFRQEEGVVFDGMDYDTARDVLIFHATRQIVSTSTRNNKHYNKNGSYLQCTELLPMANGKDTRTYCFGVDIFQKGDGNPLEKMPRLIVKNIAVCNGLVHIVDRVLLPYEIPRTVTRRRLRTRPESDIENS